MDEFTRKDIQGYELDLKGVSMNDRMAEIQGGFGDAAARGGTLNMIKITE